MMAAPNSNITIGSALHSPDALLTDASIPSSILDPPPEPNTYRVDYEPAKKLLTSKATTFNYCQ